MEVSSLRRAGEDVLLVVRLAGGEHGKAAITARVNFAFARKGGLRVDVYNATDRRILVAFWVFASDERLYSESKCVPALPGWNRLEYDLAASTYKTVASEWKHTSTLLGREDVRELAFLFYDGKAAALALDRIEVDLARGE